MFLLISLCACSAGSDATEVNGGSGGYYDGEFSLLLAGGYNTGMFFSSDLGNIWHVPITNTGRAVHDIAVGRRYIFAATGASGLYRSSDNGQTWSRAPGVPDTVLYSVYASGSLVIAGCARRGIATSTDDGDTWTVTAAFAKANFSFAALDSAIFAASSTAGVLRSSDSGKTWTILNSGFHGFTPSFVSVASGMLFATGLDIQAFRSTDLGNHWELMTPSASVAYGIAASNGVLYGGTTSGLLRSVDSGQTWDQVPEIPSSVFRPIAKTKYVFASTDKNGIFISSNGGKQWSQKNNGLTDSTFFAVGLY